MKQNRQPRNEPKLTWAVNLQQRRLEYTMGEKTASLINGVGKTGQLHAKVSNRNTLSHHVQK